MQPYYDDRLSTVISGPVPERALALVQYRQLLDLLGSAQPEDSIINFGDAQRKASGKLPASFHPEQMAAGLTRLHTLSLRLGDAQEQAAISEMHRPIKSPALLNYLFSKPATQGAALKKCRYSAVHWAVLRPLLGERAQAFLTQQGLLADIATGSADMANPLILSDAEPVGFVAQKQESNAQEKNLIKNPTDPVDDRVSESVPEPDELLLEASQSIGENADAARAERPPAKVQNIGDIVARIKRFEQRRTPPQALARPMEQLPFEEMEEQDSLERRLEFLTDEQGIITATDYDKLIGLNCFICAEQAGWGIDAASYQRFHMRMAIKSGTIFLPHDDGQGRALSARPRFDDRGTYKGYSCVISPQNAGDIEGTNQQTADSRSDHYRQLIHELRTPVGALKGFAEILQSQLFGPVSSRYRQMAETIVRDSDILLSHFNHLKYFEQDIPANVSKDNKTVAQCAEELRRCAQSMVPEKPADIGLESGEELCLSSETVDALAHWFEYFSASFSERVCVTFSAIDDENMVRVWFSGESRKLDARKTARNNEKLSFALLLTEARLLEAGVKIESERTQTIMDLPVIPVMSAVS